MPRDSTSGDTAIAGASPWALIATLGFIGTTVSFTQTLVIPIQNHLPVLVGASRGATAWVLTIALLAAAVTTPISGRLGDLVGKRHVALGLIVLAIAGSLIAAFSEGLPALLVGRALQGVSMGIIAVAISILGDEPDREHQVAGIAVIGASLGFGGAVGLPLCALIVQVGDWKLLFWSSAALGLVNAALVWRVVPHSRGSREHLDLVGATGLAVGLTGILVALSRGASWGWGSAQTLGMFLGGVTVLVVWSAYELRIEDPILDLRLMSQPSLLLINLGTTALGCSFFVSEVAFLPLLELPAESEAGLGLTMFVASIALVPGALVMMAVAPLAARLVVRFGGHTATCAGALSVAAAYALTLLWHDRVWHIVVFNSLLLAGVAVGVAAIPTLVLAAVPQDASGAAAGVNALMRSIGTSAGATITGMLLAAYSAPVAGNEIPQQAGFTSAFVLGLATAVACAALVGVSGGLAGERASPSASRHRVHWKRSRAPPGTR